jgi:hypothetical protein
MGITMDQFTEYRTSSQYMVRRTSNATPHTGPVHTLRSSLNDWKKGVKRDMTLYSSLKHDHQSDTWNRETKAVANTQGLTGNTTQTDTTSTGKNAYDNNKDSKDSNPILAMLTQQRTSFAANQQDKKHPGNITRMMSTSNAKKPPSTVIIDGHTYSIKMHRITDTTDTNGKITYQASSASSQQGGALIDRGSNGGVAGDNVQVIRIDPHRTVDVKGIDNHRITDIRIVTAGALVDTNRGPVILIMNQYAHAGKGKTIHSSGQMEWFKNTVDDRSKKVGGSQRVTTPDGYIIPISILSGLPYIKQGPYTDDKYDTHPHVFLTSNSNWNPSVLDYDGDDNTQWYDTTIHAFDDSLRRQIST